MEWILISLIIGVILISMEVFIPGGILGTLGGIALVVSLSLVFKSYGAAAGFYYLFALIVLTGLGVFLSIKLVPRSRFAHSIFLKTSESGFKSARENLSALKGKEGITLTFLRPAGKAQIEGRRIDVVTEGGLVQEHRRIRVMDVEGSRVVVREIEEA
jgi:membrane-bound ClpP family serine protease